MCCSDKENVTKLLFYCEDKELDQMVKTREDDAGFDLRCADHAVTVPAMGRVLVHTKLHVAIPPRFVGIVKSRSGSAVKEGIEVGAGVIDASYRGEVCVLLHNHGDSDVEIAYGDRIAQLCVLRSFCDDAVPVDSIDMLGVTDRGDKGFGSTGVA